MELNWAALAIPVFLVATLVEARVAARRTEAGGPRIYAFGTAIADLACGSTFLAIELVLKLLTLGAFAWLYEHRVVDWSAAPWVPWVLGIVGVDFLFYWWHRTSHVVNVLWGVHGVHHQSEDYNLAVALRQPTFEPLTWFPFYAGLALLGVSPVVYLAAYGINRVYQFWIHTELVRDLGPLEWILNTPSHHRVHHGVQTQYLDRNYGAVLVVWDRLFGTFEPEGERVIYGTTVPLRAYGPLWANVQHFDRMRGLAARARSLREKLWVPLAHPAWLPAGIAEWTPKPDRGAGYRKYEIEVPRGVQTYVLFHFAQAGVLLGVVVFFEQFLTVAQVVSAAIVFAAGFAAIVGIVERKPWAMGVERVRLVGLAGLVGWLLVSAAGLGLATAGGIVLALAFGWGASLGWLREGVAERVG